MGTTVVVDNRPFVAINFLFYFLTHTPFHLKLFIVEKMKIQFILVTLFVASVSAFNQASNTRREFVKFTSAAVTAAPFLAPFAAFAEVEVPAQTAEYAFPADWGLSFNYESDAAKVRGHMLIATGMAKGSERMEEFGKNMKKEMVDFVSYYRRFPKVAGKPSFSTLYTSINVLAGHYTSYGFKYPLPEKRRKRLYQEYSEIEKSLA